MKKIAIEGYPFIKGGVCAAKGFRAGGIYSGIKKAMTGTAPPDDELKSDLAVVAADHPCAAAGVYTQNKVKGAPVLVTQAHLGETGGRAIAVVMNSGNANTCNADGMEKAEKMCSLTGEALGVFPTGVLVMSTGVIGQILPIEPIERALPTLCDELMPNPKGAHEAALAIMTTDTIPKECAVEFTLGDTICHLGGMAKGSGMIHPDMATTLNCITTDVDIDPALLQEALSDVVKITYNCLSVDGDQSTNDTCLVLASGEAGNTPITEENDDYLIFRRALYTVMMNLTRMLAYDGEGATKLLECIVSGAPTQEDAIAIAKSVVGSNLLKCAMFGEDANWGRILCAVGYAEAEVEIDQVDVTITSEAGSVKVCEKGAGIPFSEEEAARVLGEDDIHIQITVGKGEGKAVAWGCDLTYAYVKINGDYRS